MAYAGNASHGAVVADQTVNSHSATVGVMLSGFSYDRIRDDEPDNPVIDRADHLRDILLWLGTLPPYPTGTGPRASADHLGQNYPNPFNPQTTIDYTISGATHVRVDIFDTAGRRVRRLVDEDQTPETGGHRVSWDGTDDRGVRVASGIYFYRLKAGTYTKTHKMVLLR
jgi:hypothetical protein